MKPRRNLYGIHNNFSGVGGGLRRGCILIRNRDLRGVGGKEGWGRVMVLLAGNEIECARDTILIRFRFDFDTIWIRFFGESVSKSYRNRIKIVSKSY